MGRELLFLRGSFSLKNKLLIQRGLVKYCFFVLLKWTSGKVLKSLAVAFY